MKLVSVALLGFHMLRGNYPASVDGKGRLKIPAAFKAYLDENYGSEFYVTSLDGLSVRVYPILEWRAIEDKLKPLPSMNKSVKKFLDRTNYYGQMGRADSQGRLLIPSILRESAAMHGEVAVLGYLKYLEVWNNQRYLEHLEREPFTEEDLKALSDLGI
jgi:MraZ protein